MRAGGVGLVLQPWACLAPIAPGSWTGNAPCLVMLRSIIDGARYYCKTAGSRASEKLLSIWGRDCVSR